MYIEFIVYVYDVYILIYVYSIIMLQYINFNPVLVKQYSYSNNHSSTVGKTVFKLKTVMLPFWRVRSPITDFDWKFWPTTLYVYSKLQSICLYVYSSIIKV